MRIPAPGSLSSAGRTPRVLLVTCFRWITSVRAALEFNRSGCEVHVVGPSWQAFAAQSYVQCYHPLRVLRPLKSLHKSIVAAQADLIVPLDDCARQYLNQLFASAAVDSNTKLLIEKSLGDAAQFEKIYDRAAIALMANKLGLDVPAAHSYRFDDNSDDSLKLRFPVVLKSDGSWGGQGVKIVRNRQELDAAYVNLGAAPNPLRAVWRMIRKSDFSLLWPSLLRIRKPLSLQAFVEGRPANAAVACWHGKVLASVCVEVVQSRGATGPSSVVRMCENAGMNKTIASLVQRLGLSGLCGFDFILTEDGRAVFIELNPRATPTFHLANSQAQSLINLLMQQLDGTVSQQAAPLALAQPIALFPQEMLRDPASVYIKHGHHDMPVYAPEFVKLATALSSRKSLQTWQTTLASLDEAAPHMRSQTG